MGLSDPYCLVFWNDALVGKTKVVENSVDPEFDTDFHIPLQAFHTDTMLDADTVAGAGGGAGGDDVSPCPAVTAATIQADANEYDPKQGHTVTFEFRRHHKRMTAGGGLTGSGATGE